MPHNVLASNLLLAAFTLTSAIAAQTKTVLHNFIGAKGYEPLSGVIADGSGNLYGTTSQGGEGSQGVIYKLDSRGGYSELYDFTGGVDGRIPNGVVRDNSGNLFGTTVYGGTTSNGVIFKFTAGRQFIVLHTFTGGSDGGEPEDSLILDAAGNLYGTTNTGGAFSYGTVFEYDSSGQYRVLHSFAGGVDGSYPVAGVVRDAVGNLYGTTVSGGAAGQGVVYKIDSNGEESVLHSFSGALDGGTLLGGVILDSAGNLYGATYYGGLLHNGVVYKIDTAGNETVIHNFRLPPDGALSSTALTFDGFGKLLGASSFGGTVNAGTIFAIDDDTHQESVVYDFLGGDDGSSPNRPLAIVNGNIYGTTLEGGNYGGGTLFKITPSPEVAPQ